MEKITYEIPKKKKVATHLWELAEEVAKITKTSPNRWLRSGEWTLEHALIHFRELDQSTIKSRPAYLTYLIGKYRKD